MGVDFSEDLFLKCLEKLRKKAMMEMIESLTEQSQILYAAVSTKHFKMLTQHLNIKRVHFLQFIKNNPPTPILDVWISITIVLYKIPYSTS